MKAAASKMEGIPRPGHIFIGLIALGGLSMVTWAALERHPWHHSQFLLLLVIAVLASRLKLKLPGLNGNMSVNLPFVLIAAVQLSLFEALFIALASTVAQSLPKAGGKPQAIQMLFNVSTMAVALGTGHWILLQGFVSRAPWTSTSLLLSLAAASFFLAQTIPVATIISLTEGGRMLRIWSTIFHLSFPYYVLSAGVTSLVTTASHRIGWQIPLLVLPVMYGVYRSYRLFFGRGETPALPIALAKAAGAQ